MTAVQPPSIGSQWHLKIQNGDLAAVGDVTMETFPFRIGRLPGLELTLPSCQVSGKHACIECKDGELTITDLGSTNGTFVNGQQVVQSCPLVSGDLLQLADIVFRVHKRRSTTVMQTMCEQNVSDALGCVEFERLVGGEGIFPAFQPIVDMDDGHAIGYEGLARSTFSVISNPGPMFSIAEKLKQEVLLSEILRLSIVEVSTGFENDPLIFLNSHPNELNDFPRFIMSLESLRRKYPSARLVLEIHEHAVTDIDRMKELSQSLERLEMRLAYDDFGSGQARFFELVEVPPAYLKFDIRLVRGIHDSSSQRRRVVQALVRMVHELNVIALAEGVETAAEAECCKDLGFQLAQGYHFGRPAPFESWNGGQSMMSTEPRKDD